MLLVSPVLPVPPVPPALIQHVSSNITDMTPTHRGIDLNLQREAPRSKGLWQCRTHKIRSLWAAQLLGKFKSLKGHLFLQWLLGGLCCRCCSSFQCCLCLLCHLH